MLERHELRVLFGKSIPERLKDSLDPPAVLFATGSGDSGVLSAFPPRSVPVAAIVGTRKATPYGLGFAETLGAELSASGITVVSGLALGVDAAAHRGAVQGHGIPLAVLGSGHHRPCPARNRSIAAEVHKLGVTWSEVAPGAESAPWRYPARNRLIAASADVVVVVESAAAGGSMLTVAEALRRDVEVMAVPGPVNRNASSGCIELLRDGAHVCAGAEDVLSLLGLVSSDGHSGAGAGSGRSTINTGGAPPDPATSGDRAISGDAEILLRELCGSPLAFDAAVERTGLDFGRLSTAAAELGRARLARSVDGWIEPV
jgi:DNA processing protein